MNRKQKPHLALISAAAIAAFLTSGAGKVWAQAVSWQKVEGFKVTDISIGGGKLWAISTTKADGKNFAVLHWDFVKGKWNKVNGSGTRIDVDTNGKPWIARANGGIYRYNGKKWIQVKNSASDIAVSGDGAAWMASRQWDRKGALVASYRALIKKWVYEGHYAMQVDIAPNGDVWLIDRQKNISRFSATVPRNASKTKKTGFRKLSTKAIEVSIGDGKSVWIVGTDKKPYKWDEKGRKFVKHASSVNLKTIAADSNGRIWGVTENGDVHADPYSLLLPSGRKKWNEKFAVQRKEEPKTKAIGKVGGAAKSANKQDLNKVLSKTVTACGDCNLVGAKLAKKKIRYKTFTRGNWSNVDFSGADLTGTRFNALDLSGANFSGANLTDVQFNGSDLSNADFSNATVTGAIFQDGTIKGANVKKINNLRYSAWMDVGDLPFTEFVKACKPNVCVCTTQNSMRFCKDKLNKQRKQQGLAEWAWPNKIK